MKAILTRCGYRCDLCLAYSENVKRNDQREILSKGWKAIYDINIKPEQIICEGCMSCDNPILMDKNCPVRGCVIKKKIENCGHCNDYPCDDLKTRIVDKEQLQQRMGRNITEEAYNNFVKPYESKPRLDYVKSKESD